MCRPRTPDQTRLPWLAQDPSRSSPRSPATHAKPSSLSTIRGIRSRHPAGARAVNVSSGTNMRSMWQSAEMMPWPIACPPKWGCRPPCTIGGWVCQGEAAHTVGWAHPPGGGAALVFAVRTGALLQAGERGGSCLRRNDNKFVITLRGGDHRGHRGQPRWLPLHRLRRISLTPALSACERGRVIVEGVLLYNPHTVTFSNSGGAPWQRS